MFYVYKDYLIFTFKCCKNSKSKLFEETEGDVNVIVQLSRPDASGNIMVNGWLNRVLIFSQFVPYIKNQSYEIFCRFDKSLKTMEPYRFQEPTHDMYIESRPRDEPYYCAKEIHPKVAKSLYKDMVANKLVTKPTWDRFMHHYDWKCKACNYAWVGNPECGLVFEHVEVPVNNKKRATNPTIRPDPFSYRNHHYQGIDYKYYSTLTWWNKKEYEEAAKWYYDRGLIVQEDGSINQRRLEVWKKDWPDFEDVWKWNSLTQDDIDSNGNIWGGAWRKGEEVVADKPESSGWEKVFTKGWHKEKTEFGGRKAVRCPVCEDLYKIICHSGWNPLNIFQKKRSKIVWKIDAYKMHLRNIFKV